MPHLFYNTVNEHFVNFILYQLSIMFCLFCVKISCYSQLGLLMMYDSVSLHTTNTIQYYTIQYHTIQYNGAPEGVQGRIHWHQEPTGNSA